MKKIFPIVRGAVMFLAALTLGFATTSCEDEFDDSELNSRIDDLEETVSDLEARVSALETSLNNQVGSLSDMIDGLVTVTSVTENTDGSYTIVLSDGTTFDVPAPAEEEETVPVVGIATDANGAYYWTLNGEPLLDADGNYIYLVAEEAEAVTPLFQLDAETGELQVSVDGGTTYTPTGVYINTEETVTIFTDFSYDDDYAYFTLTDGTVVSVALNAGSSESTTNVNCYALSGKQYFEYGETKEVKLSVSGISQATVTRPDGWKASVSGSTLSITAPTEDKVNTYAETEGTVTVIAVASDGRTAIAEVKVGIGTAPLAITLTETTDGVDLALDFDEENTDGYTGYVFGVVKLSSLSELDLQSYYDNWADSWYLSSYDADYTSTLADELYGETVEAGYVYVVYAICGTSSGSGWWASFDLDSNSDNMLYAVYEPVSIEVETLATTFEDATIKITASGVSQVYYYLESEDYYDLEYHVNYTINYGYGYTQDLSSGYEGSLCDFDYNYYTYYGLDYGKMYKLAFFVYEEGKYDYTVDDVILEYEIQLNPLTYDGTAVASIGDVTATTTSISADVTPGDDVYMYYCAYMTEANYTTYSTGTTEDFVSYLMTYGATREAGQVYTVSKTSLTPETVGYICSVAMDANGAFGPIQVKEATTTALVFNETITVTAEATDLSSTNSAVISWSVSGGEVASYRYLNLTNSAWLSGSNYGKGDEATTESWIATTTNYLVKKNITETSATITGLTSGTQYEFFILGIDADGLPTRMYHLTYEAGSDNVIIRSTDEDGNANSAYIDIDLSASVIQYRTWDDETYYDLPTTRGDWYTYLWDTDGGYMRMYVDFSTLPENIVKVCAYICHPDYCTGTWKTQTENVISKGTSATETGYLVSAYLYFYEETSVFYTWQDSEGQWYECKEFNVYEMNAPADDTTATE